MLKRNVVSKIEHNTVFCDTCDKSTRKINLPTPGDAADQARKEGFVTRSKNVYSPSTWHCLNCAKKISAQV